MATGATKSHNNCCQGRRHHRKKAAFRQLPRIFHGAVSWNHASFVSPGKSECERAHATPINHQAIINSTQRKVGSARACAPGTHSYKAPAEREHFDLSLNRTATHCRERSLSVTVAATPRTQEVAQTQGRFKACVVLRRVHAPVVFRGMCARTSAADTLALQHHTSFAGSESSLFHCDSIVRLCRKRAVNRRLGAAGIGHRSAGLYIW